MTDLVSASVLHLQRRMNASVQDSGVWGAHHSTSSSKILVSDLLPAPSSDSSGSSESEAAEQQMQGLSPVSSAASLRLEPPALGGTPREHPEENSPRPEELYYPTALPLQACRSVEGEPPAAPYPSAGGCLAASLPSPPSVSSAAHASTPLPVAGPTPIAAGAVAMACKLVGGGLNGSVDLCASITLVDERGDVLLDTIVKPSLPVTDYRFSSTGLSAALVNQGMAFRKARKLVIGLLRSGPSGPQSASASSQGVSHSCGQPVVLVAMNLQQTLSCLMLEHPAKFLREVDASALNLGKETEGASGRGADLARLLMSHHLRSVTQA